MWLGNIGYTIAFAAILSKMWRIYYIFHNPAPNKRVLIPIPACMCIIILHLMQAISDWYMMVLILTIATVMAVIIAIGFAIPQVLPSPVLVDDNEQRSGFNACCIADFRLNSCILRDGEDNNNRAMINS